jgi:hypothetical protein
MICQVKIGSMWLLVLGAASLLILNIGVCSGEAVVDRMAAASLLMNDEDGSDFRAAAAPGLHSNSRRDDDIMFKLRLLELLKASDINNNNNNNEDVYTDELNSYKRNFLNKLLKLEQPVNKRMKQVALGFGK